MREAYNECVPLLTAYSSELGQNAALQAGYAHGLEERGRRARSRAAQGLGERAARFPARRSRLAAPIKRPATAKWCSGWRSSPPSFPRTCSMPARAYTRSVTDSRGARRPAGNAIDRAAADAREAQSAGLAVQARSTDLHDDHDQRGECASCAATSTRPGSRAPRSSGRARAASTTMPSSRRSCRCVTSSRSCWDSRISPTTRWRRAWRRAAGRCSAFLEDLARRCRPAARDEFSDLEEFAGRKLERLGPRVLRRAAAGEPLQGLAGGAAALFPAAEGARPACSR